MVCITVFCITFEFTQYIIFRPLFVSYVIVYLRLNFLSDIHYFMEIFVIFDDLESTKNQAKYRYFVTNLLQNTVKTYKKSKLSFEIYNTLIKIFYS